MSRESRCRTSSSTSRGNALTRNLASGTAVRCRIIATSAATSTASFRSRCWRRSASLLADVLSNAARPSAARWHRSPASHHHRRAPLRQLPENTRFHPEIHFPRRHAADDRNHRKEVARAGLKLVQPSLSATATSARCANGAPLPVGMADDRAAADSTTASADVGLLSLLLPGRLCDRRAERRLFIKSRTKPTVRLWT